MANWKPSKKYDDWPGCVGCRFFNAVRITCDAYPNGIPIQIASGQADHMVKRPGQTGDTLFEPRVEATAEAE